MSLKVDPYVEGIKALMRIMKNMTQAEVQDFRKMLDQPGEFTNVWRHDQLLDFYDLEYIPDANRK